MNKTAKTSYTAALIAMGVISSASAQTVIKVTGSTAFRGNFFNAATAAANGIFDNGTAQAPLPAGAGSGSGTIVYNGKIGGVPYALSCIWSGSEAGLANLAGQATLANPGKAGANLPGVSAVFDDATGTPNAGLGGQADLGLADTSQAVSLTSKTLFPLHDFGTLGAVTFTWVKGKDAEPDSSWSDLLNVSSYQLAGALAKSQPASFFTGNAADLDNVVIVGRNAGSGTRANALADLGKVPSVFNVNQVALNSRYSAAGVLTYNIQKTAGVNYGTAVTTAQDAVDSAASYPSVAACTANSLTQNADGATAPLPNFVGVADDGYDSGAFVSDSLSCDINSVAQAANDAGTAFKPFLIIGYAGISDASHARAGVAYAANESAPSQPGGAVWLTLDGVGYSDAAVITGNYHFWGHEHLYGQVTPTTTAITVAQAVYNGVAGAGGLAANGAGGPTAGIKNAAMAADKPGGGDLQFPAPIVPPATFGEAFNP